MAQTPPSDPQKPVPQGKGCPRSAATPLVLKLYIADSSTMSQLAIGNLTDLLRSLPTACYQLEIIDGLDDPLRAVREGVLVTPTLRKVAPEPAVSLLGDLHDRQQVLRLLGIVNEPHE